MVENSFGILVMRFRVLLTTMVQRPKVVRDIVLTCVVLHNMLRSHQGQQTDQGTGPSRELQKPIEGGQTSTRPTKDYFNHVEVLAGQEDRV